MKKRTLFLVLTLLAVFACNKTLPSETASDSTANLLLTKGGLAVDPKSLDTEYFVSPEDVQAYTHFRQLLAKNDGVDLTVERIKPLGPQEDVTLCYLINYNDGWEVISADKRTPVVLAAQEAGSLNPEESQDNEAIAAQLSWIGYLADDVLAVRSDPDYAPDSPEAEENIAASKTFWTALTNPEALMVQTKSGMDPGEPGQHGHWELHSTTYETEVYDQNVLTTTTWHQDAPYNSMVPLYFASSTHMLAGSAAIAGAQMLYYLYSHSGFNTSIPSWASASGDCLTYEIQFDNFSSSNWTNIASGNTSAIAILIAYLAKYLPTQWQITGETISSFNGLRSSVFSSLFGISSTQQNYNASVVKTSLENGIPVIVNSIDYDYYGLLPEPACAQHVALVDRYKRVRSVTTYHYVWIPDNNELVGFMTEYDETFFGTPYISDMIGLNWGLYPTSCNDTWYSVSGNWNVQSYTYSSSGREMLYNFSMN